jgi:hypothetical protein
VKRVALVLVFVGAVAASTVGSTAPDAVVRADGQIGRLRIDVTTKGQLLAFAGKPDRVESDFSPPRTKPAGRTFYYRCGPGCETAYSINNATGTLSDFQTSSPHFVTEHGSRIGTGAAESARRERSKPGPGCGTGPYIHVRWDLHHTFVLTAWDGKVDEIIYLGPHSVYYDGLC